MLLTPDLTLSAVMPPRSRLCLLPLRQLCAGALLPLLLHVLLFQGPISVPYTTAGIAAACTLPRRAQLSTDWLSACQLYFCARGVLQCDESDAAIGVVLSRLWGRVGARGHRSASGGTSRQERQASRWACLPRGVCGVCLGVRELILNAHLAHAVDVRAACQHRICL